MGTRHLVAVQIGGEYKVAQYGQFDGYPDGQGVSVLDFLREGDIPALKRNLANTYAPTEEDKIRMWAEVGQDIVASKGFVSLDVSQEFEKLYPSLHRNTGAEILEVIASSDGVSKIPLENAIEFAGRSLFCEWAYVVDFDLGTFEVYTGFNKEGPVPEGARFHDIAWDDEYKSSQGKTYYQVSLFKAWKLDELPTEEEFLEAFKEPDEDEESTEAAQSE